MIRKHYFPVELGTIGVQWVRRGAVKEVTYNAEEVLDILREWTFDLGYGEKISHHDWRPEHDFSSNPVPEPSKKLPVTVEVVGGRMESIDRNSVLWIMHNPLPHDSPEHLIYAWVIVYVADGAVRRIYTTDEEAIKSFLLEGMENAGA